MKKTLYLSLLLLFLSLPQTSGAQSYPSTCPPEAQAIVNAVGGCAAVNPRSFSAVYNRCCSSTELTTGNTPASAPSAPSYAVYIAIAVVLIAGFLMWKKK